MLFPGLQSLGSGVRASVQLYIYTTYRHSPNVHSVQQLHKHEFSKASPIA